MAPSHQLRLALLLAAILIPVPSLADSGSCVFLAAGIGIEQDPFDRDGLDGGEFAARAGVFRSLLAKLEAGLEVGYVGLGRFSHPFCGESGTPDCSLEGERLDSIDILASLRWRPRVGPVRPHASVGGGVFAVKGGKATESALLREIRGGVSAAIGISSGGSPGLGAEVRWLVIPNTGPSWDRNFDIVTLMVGLNLD